MYQKFWNDLFVIKFVLIIFKISIIFKFDKIVIYQLKNLVHYYHTVE